MNEKIDKHKRDLSYNIAFPKSKSLRMHEEKNPDSFLIQFIGARGVGKSTLINYLRHILGIKDGEKAHVGLVETTLVTAFYDATYGFKDELKTTKLRKVFLCDQPGISGTTITRNFFNF